MEYKWIRLLLIVIGFSKAFLTIFGVFGSPSLLACGIIYVWFCIDTIKHFKMEKK